MLINIGIVILSISGYIHCAEGTDYTLSGTNFDQTETDAEFAARLDTYLPAASASSSTLPAPAVPLGETDRQSSYARVANITRDLALDCLPLASLQKVSSFPPKDKNDLIILKSMKHSPTRALDALFNARENDALFVLPERPCPNTLKWQIAFIAAFRDNPEASGRISSIVANICLTKEGLDLSSYHPISDPEKFSSLVVDLGDFLGAFPEIDVLHYRSAVIAKARSLSIDPKIIAFLEELGETCVEAFEGEGDAPKGLKYQRAFSLLAHVLLPS